MGAETGLGTGVAILLGAGIAVIGSVITTVLNLLYQAVTTRQGARRARREGRRKRIDEKVNMYAELMAKYWGSANHEPEELRQMESRSQGLKAYIARQIEIWCREEGKQRGDVVRDTFQQMVFHAEGGSFQGAPHEASHERATQVWTKAAALLSTLDDSSSV